MCDDNVVCNLWNLKIHLMEVVDNEDMRHFETRDNSNLAFIEYQVSDRKIFLIGYEFPEGFEESGKAKIMIEQILDMIEQRSMRVVPMKLIFKQHFRSHASRKKLLPVGLRI